MGDVRQPDSVQPLPQSDPFQPAPVEDRIRPAGALPPVVWDVDFAARLRLGGQVNAGEPPPNQQFHAADRRVAQAAATDRGDRPLRADDRAPAANRLEDEKTAELLCKTIKEMQAAVSISDERMAKIEAELKAGQFGPETRRAYALCARILEDQVMGNLVVLDSRGVEIPAGCPLEPPLDPRSGRHVMPEWFRAQLQNGDLRLKLSVADDKVPGARDIAQLRSAGIWSTRAMAVLESTIIQSNLAQVESQLQKLNFEGRFNGWMPRKDLTDREKEKWTCAAQTWLNDWIQVRNYAHAIAQLNVATKQSSEPDKLFGIPVYKWSTIARQVFSDEALKDENFPGHVERDENGNIKSVAIDVPATLDRTSANLVKMEKLHKWLEKYGPQVDQLMREVSFAAAQEGRLLGWAELPVEGTIKPDGFNVVVKEKKPDYRGGFVEVPVAQQHFNSQEDANKALAELKRQYAGKPEMVVVAEPAEKVEFSENPGILLGGRKLAPGEKEFNLREFRFTAQEVIKDGQKMIAVRSTQTYEYAPPWALYNCYSSAQRTAISGTEKEPVYYKPDDWVCVMDGGRTMMMQAKNLATFASENKTWHYGMKAANIGMDVGFLVTGGIEIGAVWKAAAKEATEQGMKLAISEGLKKAAFSRGSWHTLLGATGVLGHPLEEMFGKYGHEFMKYRSYAMLADITVNQTFVGDWVKSAWGAARGTAAVEKVSAIEQLLASEGKWVERIAFLYKRTGNALLATEFLQIADIVGKAVPDMVAQTRAQAIGRDIEKARQYRGPAFSPDAPTALKIDSLMKETEKVKALPAGTDQRKSEESALTTRLTTSFLDSKSPEERLAAALALLNLKGTENGELPVILGTRTAGDKTDVVKFADVQAFLRDFQRQQLTKLLSEYDALMPVEGSLSLKRTIAVLATPENSRERQDHIDNLIKAFQQQKDLQDNLSRLETALEKARQDQKDGERKSPEEKARLAGSVTELTAQLAKARSDWNGADKKAGAVAALSLLALGLDKENGQLDRTILGGRVKAGDLTDFLERQAKTSTEPQVKYVLSDLLFRMGKVDLWQWGGTCQDLLRDSSIKDAALARNLKIAAMFNETSPRIGEMLEMMRYSIEPQLARLSDAGDRARAFSHTYGRDALALKETLLATVRNQKEDPDVRAMAARLLLASSAATQEERRELFQQCRNDWQRCQREQGSFARQFVSSLKLDLNSNTEAGDQTQRQRSGDKKFRAALTLSELGGPPESGIDADIRRKTTQALIDCLDYTQPALALQILPHLVPKRLGEFTPQQLKDVRDTFQQMLGAGMEFGRNTPDAQANAQARTPLRLAVIERLPQIMAGATAQQKNDVINTLKGIIAYDERYRNFFAAGQPDLRAAAVKTLVELCTDEPTKAGSAAMLKQLVGAGDALKKDASPDVRLAAVNGLVKLQVNDLQAVALQLLKTEKDPLVIDKLWSLEYSERRPDFNSRRSRAAFESAQRKLLDSLDNSSLEDGKALIDRLRTSGTIAQRQGWFDSLLQMARGGGDDAAVARRALAHMILSNPDSSWAAKTLAEICEKDGPKAGKEMATLIERCLLSQPRMQAASRSYLLEALDALKPGSEGSPVSREDAAILIATILERDLRNMPRYNVPQNPLDHRTLMVDMPDYRRGEHLGLQLEALRYLQKYGSDKVIPLLESLAEGGIVRDAAGRPAIVKYPNGTSRQFVYESTTNSIPRQVIEQPSGEIWTRGNRNGICFDWTSNKGGKRTARADIVLRNGEYSYEDADRVRHIFTESGAEIQRKDGQVTQVTYPDGKIRRFTYEQYDDGYRTTTRMTSVTELPKNETWARSKDDKNTWTNGKGGSIKSYCDFVIGSFNCYGSRGGEDGTYCRVTQVGDTSVMQVFTPSGAELQVRNGVITEVSAGSTRHNTHPSDEMQQRAGTLLATYRDGTALLKAQAEELLRQSPELSKKSNQQLADEMGRAVGDNRIDSASVCRTIFLACLAGPIKSVEDPRRLVLQQTLKDAHPQVRIAAARMLFERSDIKSDRQQAAAVLADIEKNGSRLGYRRDAMDFLGDVSRLDRHDAYHPDDWKIVSEARKNAPDRPQKEPDTVRQTLELVDDKDSDFQRAFENVKVELSRGNHNALSMSWHQWKSWFNEHDLRLLDAVNFSQLKHTAVRNRWEGHSWEWHTSSWDFINREEQKARDAQVPFLWAQFDQLIDRARTKGDKDPEGIQSREALAYIILSGGESFDPEFSAEAVKRAADGILDICKGSGPGRGDLSWALKACLVEQPRLDPAVRLTLLKAVDQIVAPRGNMSKETAANMAALALEAEYRNMPRQGEPGYEASVNLQLELLDRIKSYGNRELVPVMEAIAKFHRDAQIKRKAAELSEQMKK